MCIKNNVKKRSVFEIFYFNFAVVKSRQMYLYSNNHSFHHHHHLPPNGRREWLFVYMK